MDKAMVYLRNIQWLCVLILVFIFLYHCKQAERWFYHRNINKLDYHRMHMYLFLQQVCYCVF